MRCPDCDVELTKKQRGNGLCPGCGKLLDAEAALGSISDLTMSFWAKTVTLDMKPEGTIKSTAQPGATTTTTVKERVVARLGATSVENADYELLEILGKGGMGIVYAARQASINRTVAVKLMGQHLAANEESRQQFLSEAAATGDLDHPGIVPIYDLGTNDEGALFYAMKKVQGVTWKESIRDKTQKENLEILLRVTDAVAFAHSRGMIHRDLKPENVMLGAFGEVLITDWGLVLSVGGADGPVLPAGTKTLCGTPAYMAPEMARGNVMDVGFGSDVYLLGAILYEVITGKPPHAGTDTKHCLEAAAKNEIDAGEHRGELFNIALKAMSSWPEDRYAGAMAFRSAIKDYQEHSDSVDIAGRARQHLHTATQTSSYSEYQRALFGFREARSLWSEYEIAAKGESETLLAYASCALRNADLDLAASMLESGEPAHQHLLLELKNARNERDHRQKRIRFLRRTTLALLVTVAVVSSVSVVWIRYEQSQREAERRQSAPALIESGRFMIDRKDYDNALVTLTTALEFDSELVEANLLRAVLMIQLGDFEGALEECKSVVDHNPTYGEARSLLNICEQVLRQGSESAPLGELAMIVGRLGLPMLASGLVGSSTEKLFFYRTQIEKAWPELARFLVLTADGKLTLKLEHADGLLKKQVTDLSPLRGIPLHTLEVNGCPVVDLSPLEGMPLRSLRLVYTGVRDLGPLSGVPLVNLDLRNSSVSDLTPLKGLPLVSLDLNATGVSDLSPLRGLTLGHLSVANTHVRDLSPLQGMPLVKLDVGGCRNVSDLEPLRGMPLTWLQIVRTPISDLHPLVGMKLKYLDIRGSRVRDLSPVRNMPTLIEFYHDDVKP